MYEGSERVLKEEDRMMEVHEGTGMDERLSS